ncbi:MAG TPA: fructosamine kinase family protein [Gammaproteobacteria bacterium]
MPADDSLLALRTVLRQSGLDITGEPPCAVGGGSISRTVKVETTAGPVLVKVEPAAGFDLLDAEAAALEALRDARAIRVPEVAAKGCAGRYAFLAIEWIDFGRPSPAAERRLGTGLAALHRVTAGDFGWHRDNYIGRTPQRNDRSGDWIGFYRERRLRFQLEIARRNGIGEAVSSRGTALLENLERFFDGYRPAPSLLHGDLWGGNWGAAAGDEPCVFDPAAYFGDREADLAMTRLFGGFGPEFYRAYEEAWPLAEGWERRVELYNLYHLLNHFNLFGGGYRHRVEATLRSLLRG